LVSELTSIMIFKIFIFLNQLANLMTCTKPIVDPPLRIERVHWQNRS
jgi:hypothetical protein